MALETTWLESADGTQYIASGAIATVSANAEFTPGFVYTFGSAEGRTLYTSTQQYASAAAAFQAAAAILENIAPLLKVVQLT
jgi:hypothetical protein